MFKGSQKYIINGKVYIKPPILDGCPDLVSVSPGAVTAFGPIIITKKGFRKGIKALKKIDEINR